MAFLFGARAAAQLAYRMAIRRGATRFAARRAAVAAGARHVASAGRAGATSAARAGVRFAQRNPMSTGYVAGAATEYGMRGKRKLSGFRKGRIVKRPRKSGPVPSGPSSRVPARYAVAPTMTKFRKAKVTKEKVPKSAIVHYKEFGQFNAQKCMYINHEHWGSIDKLWKGIGYGLTKLILNKAKIYNGKSMEDACIGPRTNPLATAIQLEDKTSNTIMSLVFASEGVDGAITRSQVNVNVEDIGPTPDVYRSFDNIATDVTAALRSKYNFSVKTWLCAAQIQMGGSSANTAINAQNIYIQNLDDAEIHLYVHSLVKFQNVTLADHGTGAGSNPYDKAAIDANPLVGRVYTAKGHYPQIDTDLLDSGDRTLDTFFGDVDDTTLGITLLGHNNNHTSNDLGRISSIPKAKELYGNQLVKSGVIHMAPGAMKFHKTTFTLNKTFRALAGIGFVDVAGGSGRRLGMHSMFGLTLQHRHGADAIQIGYNRDTDVGCYIKHKTIVHPLKTNYTLDSDVVQTNVIPTEFQ